MSNDRPEEALALDISSQAIPGANMPSPTPDNVNQILRLLRRINHATDLHSKHLIKATGLTTPQLIVLKAISELGRSPRAPLPSRLASAQEPYRSCSIGSKRMASLSVTAVPGIGVSPTHA